MNRSRQVLWRQISLRSLLLFARVLGFRFVWAESESDKKRVYRLRYKIYSEAGYIDPSVHPNKEFYDKYDMAAQSLLVTLRGKVVGTVRVIRNSSIGFPVQNLFNIQLPGEAKDMIGISRLCILKEFRRKSFPLKARIVTMSMMAKIYFYSKEKDIKMWSFVLPEKLKKSFDKLGVSLTKIPEKPLEEKHHKERELIAGYFAKPDIYPYVLNAADL